MGITALWKELTIILPRQTVIETPLVRGFQAANAKYEALWDIVCPGGSAQVYQGHDHTPNGGGGPINRGSLWSLCSLSAFFDLDFAAKEEALEIAAVGSALDIAMIHPSPGLRTTALLTGWICYSARSSDAFTLELSANGTAYDIPLKISEPTDPPKIHFTKFALLVLRPGVWHPRNFYIRCGSYDSAVPPVVSFYGIQIDELQNVLRRKGHPETERPPVTGNTILVAFPRLEDDLVAKDEWVSSYPLRQFYSFKNGLYEGTEEKRAPGASAQVCRGHDHDAAGYGGRALSRGGLLTGRNPAAAYMYRIAWDGTGYSGYYAWDYDDGADRRSLAGVGMARFLAAPGITSSGSPPTTAPYLTAYFYVKWDAGGATPTMNFRALHLALAQYSAVTTIAATATYAGWIVIDKIPCQGGVPNSLQWEVEMTGTGNTVDIDLVAFTVYEVPGVGGRTDPGSKNALASGVD